VQECCLAGRPVGKDQMAKPWAWGPAVPADFTDNTTEGTTANPVRAE